MRILFEIDICFNSPADFQPEPDERARKSGSAWSGSGPPGPMPTPGLEVYVSRVIHREDTRRMKLRVRTGLELKLKNMANFLETFKNRVILVVEVKTYIRLNESF